MLVSSQVRAAQCKRSHIVLVLQDVLDRGIQCLSLSVQYIAVLVFLGVKRDVLRNTILGT